MENRKREPNAGEKTETIWALLWKIIIYFRPWCDGVWCVPLTFCAPAFLWVCEGRRTADTIYAGMLVDRIHAWTASATGHRSPKIISSSTSQYSSTSVSFASVASLFGVISRIYCLFYPRPTLGRHTLYAETILLNCLDSNGHEVAIWLHRSALNKWNDRKIEMDQWKGVGGRCISHQMLNDSIHTPNDSDTLHANPGIFPAIISAN